MTDLIADQLPAGLADVATRPGEAGYDAEVSGFNAAVNHGPELVITPRTAEQVVAAVRYAAAAGLAVGVQATGHGANAAQDGGMLINTRLLQRLDIDPGARTATVGAGVRWRAVIDAAAPHGLTGLCGSTSDVSVVGYSVGGGLPVLGRAFGFAADRIRRVQVVTGDGTLREVDAEQNPDLFAALRGGGGNSGVVTEMTFELLPLREVYGGGVFFRGEDAATVLPAYLEWVRTVPGDMCSSLAFLRLPPLPEVPEPLRGRLTMHLRIAYPGDPAEGERLVAPMRACAQPLMDMVGVLPCQQLDLIHQDPDHPVPFVTRGWLLPEIDAGAADALLTQAGPDSACPLLLVELRHLGGALSAPAATEDCIGARVEGFVVSAIGALMGPAAAAVPAGLAAVEAALAPHRSSSTLLNLHGSLHDDDDRARPWTAEQYARLRRVRATYDPADLFRFGHAVMA